mgnify:CR=1 FL=1
MTNITDNPSKTVTDRSKLNGLSRIKKDPNSDRNNREVTQFESNQARHSYNHIQVEENYAIHKQS